MRVRELLDELNLGKSVAESDERLENYFVDTYTFNAVLQGKADIVAGDKGTGKTALYQILMKRYRTSEHMRGVDIIPAFNVAGSPIFQQLLNVPVQTEGQYIAFWKTFFLTLVGNWMLDQPTIVRQPSVKRVEYFLEQNQLKTIDSTPNGVFARLVRFISRATPRSAEVKLGFGEEGLPQIVPKIEFMPAAVVQPPDYFGIDYAAGLRILEASLKESNLTLWLVLDRLDEAFLGYPGVEVPALRALFRCYLDFKAVSRMKVKLFVRRDLFRKLVDGGFVNLTHVNDQKIEIIWDDDDLKNLLIARVKDTPFIVENLGLKGLSNDEAFARLFPDKVNQGEKQSTTWNWIISRIRDGNGVIAPRNLIDLVQKAREAQIRAEARSPRDFGDGISLIEAEAIRKAQRALSETRVQDTLIAEAPEMVPLIEKFRNKKTEHNTESLCDLLGVKVSELRLVVRPLLEMGLLEEAGTSFKVPMLYRDGLNMSQGKAFGGAVDEINADD
jgi:hypothetical protein